MSDVVSHLAVPLCIEGSCCCKCDKDIITATIIYDFSNRKIFSQAILTEAQLFVTPNLENIHIFSLHYKERHGVDLDFPSFLLQTFIPKNAADSERVILLFNLVAKSL